MIGFSGRKVLGVVVYLLLVLAIKAQPGCPAVSAGNPVTLPCGTSCTTLTAVPFQTGATTTYSVSQIPFNPPVAFNGGTALPATGDDYWSDVIDLPFKFCFFGGVYSAVIVESNGVVSFDTTYATLDPASWTIDTSTPAPYAGEDNDLDNCIMGPYQDLDNTYQGTIYYYIGGTAPCRYFVASWYDLAMFGDSNSVSTSSCLEDDHQTQMIVIYETTNVIEIYIKNKAVPCDDGDGVDYWNGGDAIEGIQNASLTTFVGVPGRNATQWSASNDAWRFTPSGPSNVSVSWFNGTTQISNDSVVQVCPSATTTYTARAIYAPCAGGANDTVTDNVTVTLSGSLNAGVDSVKNVTCFGLNNGKIYASINGGTPPVTYGWSNGSTLLTLTNLSPGTYVFTAQDGGGCTRRDSVFITQPVQLSATVPSVSQTNCLGTGTGSLTAQPAGGNSPYTYSWTNAEAGVSDTVITAGNYTVTVTDAQLCTVTASGTLTVNTGASPVVINEQSLNNEKCFGDANGSIVVNATNGITPYQYSWSDFETGNTASNLSSGSYAVTATDGGGCTATATFNVTDPTPLNVNATVQNIDCGNVVGSITASGTGGTPAYTYDWSELFTGQTFSGATITNLQPDFYDLTITDANGCMNFAEYEITQSSSLSFTTDSVSVSCFGGNDGSVSVSITNGTPPYFFTWNQGTPTTDSVLNNLSAGPVDILVTDSSNCMVETTIQVNQPAQLAIQLVNSTNVSCNGGSDGSITVTATGGTPGFVFNWNNAETGTTDTALAAGLYGVLATDTNGCTAAASYNISQPTAISISAPTIQNIGCLGGNTGSITANVTQGSPPYTFNWVEQPGGQVFNGQTINNLAVGSYSFTITDAHGCMDSASYSITAITPLSFTAVGDSTSCFGGNNGSAQVSVTSGTPPYQFIWNNGAAVSDSVINNLTAGFLAIAVTDANNCLADTTISIGQPTQISIALNSRTEVLCNGGNNGELVVSARGGTPGYSYNWSNQFIGPDNTSLTAGNYILIVLDNNDCADTAQFVITQPTPVTANPIVTNVLCNGGADGSIDANPSGGSPLYNFNWSNGQTTQIASQLAKGSYDCTITDANGCIVIATDTVGQPAPMVILDTPTAVKCIGQHSGTVRVSVTGDTPPYFYNATQDNVNFISSSNGVILGLDTGVYTIQVSDSLGCTVLTYVYIPPAIPDEFFPPLVDSTLCYGPEYNDGAAFILDSTIQNGPYQYGIDGGALQDTGYFQNLSAGPHIITAVNANGCVDTIPIVVPEPLPIEAIVTPDSITLPLGGSQSVLVTYLNATNPTYYWANTLGFSCIDCPNPVVSGYAPGDYVVTLSMVNGSAICYGSTTLHVSVLPHTRAFIPNAFTPNGDGNNDVFQIYGEDIKTISMKVFNRWGELVYSTTNSLAGWDGTYKGIVQMPAVFTYEATITYLDDTQESKNGSITLVR